VGRHKRGGKHRGNGSAGIGRGELTLSKRCRIIVGLLSVLFAACAGSATGFASSAADFYRGKTVRIIVGFGAGGGYDIYARLIGMHLGRYIPGNPDVIVENMPGASSLKAADYVYNVGGKDGTVIGLFLNNFVLAKLLTPSLRYQPEKFTWLGRADSAALFGLVSKKSGLTSVEDAKKRDVIVASTGATAMDAMVPWALNRLAGTRFKVVTGYKSNSDSALALERGESDGMGAVSLPFIVVQKPTWLTDGVVKLIYVDDLKRDPSYPDVPTIAEFGTNEEDRAALNLIASSSTIGRSFVAAPGIPEDRAKALRDAFDALFKDPAFLEYAKKRNLDVNPMSAVEVLKMVQEVIATPQPIVSKTAAVTQAPSR
jgi:tripartite-type tricarboxylate transporter receptor subunit TctC